MGITCTEKRKITRNGAMFISLSAKIYTVQSQRKYLIVYIKELVFNPYWKLK